MHLQLQLEKARGTARLQFLPAQEQIRQAHVPLPQAQPKSIVPSAEEYNSLLLENRMTTINNLLQQHNIVPSTEQVATWNEVCRNQHSDSSSAITQLVALYGSFGVDLNHQLPDELTTYQVYADSSIRSQSNVPLLMPSPTLVDEDALVPEHMRLPDRGRA